MVIKRELGGLGGVLLVTMFVLFFFLKQIPHAQQTDYLSLNPGFHTACLSFLSSKMGIIIEPIKHTLKNRRICYFIAREIRGEGSCKSNSAVNTVTGDPVSIFCLCHA